MNRTIGLISANYTMPGYDTLSEERPVASMPYLARCVAQLLQSAGIIP